MPITFKTLKDATGATFTGAFYDDGTGNLFNASVVIDPATNLPAPYTGSSAVQGGVAPGATPSDAPVPEGGRAVSSTPTAVANNQIQFAMYDLYGRQVTIGALRSNKAMQATSVAVTTETTIVTADAANKNDVYILIISNNNTTNPVSAVVKDSTGGTTRFTFQIPAGSSDGFTLPVDSAVPQAAANSNWSITCTGTSVNVSVSTAFIKAGP